ncbi:hypothetical protein ABFS82_03G045600 [Erythranthe guttata]|nr:PREDICTED: uncharacterized protein LOC105971359 [Erythranthe guttata]|eukprot:XP_012851660.1 PREDICTED: uncharacterized protein LOC105971359 [Erythranthe guttata]
MMNMFYQEEPPNPFKRFKFLKDLFTKRRSFRPDSIPEEAEPITDFDQQEEVFISAIVGKYIESKRKQRKSRIGIDSFKWPLSPQATEKRSNCGKNREEFLSACSRLSRCSSATSFDESFSVKTRFSRSSSLSGTHVNRDYFVAKQSFIIREMIIECEGWPFGLCRKTLLQPPLPKSPSNSWSWRKIGRRVNIHE